MINLYPGPSQLFHSVRDHLRQALKLKVPELPVDGLESADLIHQTSQRLRELLSIPAAFTLYFLPSSDIIRERMVHDLVHRHSAHVGAGDLSERLNTAAERAGITASRHPTPASALPAETELITIAHTEDTGARFTADEVSRIARSHPEALVAVDASYALPYATLPYDDVDSVFFDLHFGFGLPQGLAVWIVNDNCFNRHVARRKLPGFHDSLYSLSHLRKNGGRDGASRDISLLMIAVLNGVLGDMLSRGIATIRQETDYKAALLYHLMGDHPLVAPAVSARSARSKTILAADCGGNYQRMATALQQHAIAVGTGRGEFHERHLLFANFPSHSREQYERVTDILTAIR